jgi:hypothetical protein
VNIKQKGKKWCLYDDEGEEVGEYDSKSEAVAARRKHEDEEEEVEEMAAVLNATSAGGVFANFEMNYKAAGGIWAKVKDQEHPHAACVAMMKGKVDDPHAFCAAVEKEVAGTTPAGRAAAKNNAQVGDKPGHPFRGNQHTKGRGGDEAQPGSFILTDDAHGSELGWVKEVHSQNIVAKMRNGRDAIFSKADIKVLDSEEVGKEIGDEDWEDSSEEWLKGMSKYMAQVGDKPGHPFRGNQHTKGEGDDEEKAQVETLYERAIDDVGGSPDGIRAILNDNDSRLSDWAQDIKPSKPLDSEEAEEAHAEMIGRVIDKVAQRLRDHLKVSKKAAQSYANRIDGVQIFAPGSHNGDSYTEQDVDDLIASHGQLDYRPALKQGHVKDETGLTALGWVENLRKQGGKLVADFVDIPDAVYAAIKDRKLDRVSSEIFWNFKRAGKTYRRALKAVALLGAEIPAVAGLRPLHEHFSDASADALKYADETPLRPEPGASSAAANPKTTEASMNQEEQDKLQADLKAAQEVAAAEKAKREAAEAKVAALALQIPTGKGTLADAAKAIELAAQDGDVKRLTGELNAAKKAADEEKEKRIAAERAIADHEAEVKRLSESHRNNEIERVVATCRIPAFRPFVKHFLQVAAEAPQARVYALDNKEIEPTEAVQAMITWVNDNAKQLFTVYSRNSDEPPPSDDPGKEVDARVKKYRAANKDVDYETAMTAVFAADPALKVRYTQHSMNAA